MGALQVSTLYSYAPNYEVVTGTSLFSGCDHTLVFSSGAGPAMVPNYRSLFDIDSNGRMPMMLVDGGLGFVNLYRDIGKY